jgi:hypothetical protein
MDPPGYPRSLAIAIVLMAVLRFCIALAIIAAD